MLRGRIIDLSRRAAQLVGMIGTGTAKVRVQILPDESRQAVLLAQQGEIPSAERIASAVPTEKVTAETLVPPPGVQAAPGPTTAAPRMAGAAAARTCRGRLGTGRPAARPSNTGCFAAAGRECHACGPGSAGPVADLSSGSRRGRSRQGGA